MELPRYQMPRPADLALALFQRAVIFLKRAGTIIFATTVILWLLLSYPRLPEGAAGNQLDYSAGGRIASVIATVTKPIGFNHDIAIAILPAMAAREVAVSALATAYAIDSKGDDDAATSALKRGLPQRWSLGDCRCWR